MSRLVSLTTAFVFAAGLASAGPIGMDLPRLSFPTDGASDKTIVSPATDTLRPGQ